MPPFRPTHDQPVTLAQLRLLEPELLANEISRLQNSISHLERSNDELRAFARGEGEATADLDLDEALRREFADTVQENEETIARQQERIVMIRLALEEQVGVAAGNNPHYAAAAPPSEYATRTPGQEATAVDRAAAASSTMPQAAPSALPPRSTGPNGVLENGADARRDGDDPDGMYL